MMNKVLIAKLSKPMQALYTSKTDLRTLPNDLFRIVASLVRETRKREIIIRETDRITTPMASLMKRIAERARDFPHQGGAWSRVQIRLRSRSIYEGKTPPVPSKGEAKWVSVELECVVPNNQCETTFVRWVGAAGYSKFITVKDDGSITPDGGDCESEPCGDCNGCCGEDGECDNPQTAKSDEHGREIVVSFLDNAEGHEMLRAVCSKINSLDFYVNKTCGTHVHFDMRHLSKAAVRTQAKRLANTVEALRSILPKSRANNSYCRSTINTFATKSSRYAFVNLQAYTKYRTLEVRGHSGTTDATKILNWIRICKTVMEKRGAKDVMSVNVNMLLSNFTFPQELAAYILERARKFSGETPHVQPEDDIQDDNQSVFELAA